MLKPSDWTKTQNSYVSATGAEIGPIGGKDQAFQVQSENTAANGSGLYGQLYYTAKMDVVKGTTYTFSYSAFGNYGSYDKPNSRVMYVDLSANGTGIGSTYSTRTSDFGNTQLPIQAKSTDTAPWADYTASYTATETKTIDVVFAFHIPDKVGSQTSSDDIYITLPTIACS
ncbi:hypothetical protein [Rathayibacter rathayi]|uniref:hypothetical protein n=1 Tax=Rathayibacter rathayi TaxID=33887 RepID=UPI000CE7271E|nr:hypothetical protein [Rathayibacter rathayi]PPG93155.1 hypothetical protein C5C22_11655 [Rathayibacter rathayi]